jgi:H+/Cl- antiporter ClcA
MTEYDKLKWAIVCGVFIGFAGATLFWAVILSLTRITPTSDEELDELMRRASRSPRQQREK